MGQHERIGSAASNTLIDIELVRMIFDHLRFHCCSNISDGLRRLMGIKPC